MPRCCRAQENCSRKWGIETAAASRARGQGSPPATPRLCPHLPRLPLCLRGTAGRAEPRGTGVPGAGPVAWPSDGWGTSTARAGFCPGWGHGQGCSAPQYREGPRSPRVAADGSVSWVRSARSPPRPPSKFPFWVLPLSELKLHHPDTATRFGVTASSRPAPALLRPHAGRSWLPATMLGFELCFWQPLSCTTRSPRAPAPPWSSAPKPQLQEPGTHGPSFPPCRGTKCSSLETASPTKHKVGLVFTFFGKALGFSVGTEQRTPLPLSAVHQTAS